MTNAWNSIYTAEESAKKAAGGCGEGVTAWKTESPSEE